MSSLRRLAKDHAALRASLPPNYLFPHPSDPINSAIPDDLTNLAIYLTGPTSTPYASGLFLLRLRIPQSYPANPPTATFRTKIFHPNVDDKTGAVCLETLKRDWDPKLTLKDILVHISCLLLQPNPDSALNENAGVLVREDYDGFERKARLMTKIHASTSRDYEAAAEEARTRGEEENEEIQAHGVRKGLKVKYKENGKPEIKSKSSDNKTASDLSLKENSQSQQATGLAEVRTDSVLGKRSVSGHAQPSEDGPWQPLNHGSVLRNEVTGEPLRKSPKHETSTETVRETGTTSNIADSVEKENANYGPAKQERIGESVVVVAATTSKPLPLRRISNMGPGKLRPYARIGIRRL